MTKMPPSLKNDFREIARRIIAEDRWARRYGRSQNTVGAIAKALERAYKKGGNDALSPPYEHVKDNSVIRWEDIPPSGRNVLYTVAIWLNNRPSIVKGYESLFVRAAANVVSPRWVLSWDVSEVQAPLFSRKGIGPLLKLNILVSLDEQQNHLAITDIGIATVDAYQRRRDQHDPTLPVELR